MPERSVDWLKQAEKDLESAYWQKKGKFFEWSCFCAQQAAEKALKALYQRLGGEAWGHSVFNLLQGLQERIDVPEELLNMGKKLDRFYLLTRYPNGWDWGAPYEYYTEEDADEAISCAEEIIRFCKSFLVK